MSTSRRFPSRSQATVALAAAVILTVACTGDQRANVTAPDAAALEGVTASHHDPGHDGGPGGGTGGGGGDDDGGSSGLATFEWRVAGDAGFVPDENPDLISEHKLKKNTTEVVATFDTQGPNAGKRVDVGFLIDQGITSAETCFGDGDGAVESTDGILPPGSFVVEGENQPSMFSQIVFTGSNQDGTETVKYRLIMDGALQADDSWLPGIGETADVSLDSWTLSTQNRDKKQNPCRGSGTFGVELSITRTS